MSVAALWAWIMANEAAVATILLIVSELLGALPAVKANGILSFLLLKGKDLLAARGAKDPTPND
jgi:hypothetical protein